MKAITPLKLMPPFQSTAASGIFPTEHTNEMTATRNATGRSPFSELHWSFTMLSMSPNKLHQKLTPPSIIPNRTCVAVFNQGRDISVLEQHLGEEHDA